MENRIKEVQGDLFADRTSTAMMRENQLRLVLLDCICALVRAAPNRFGAHHPVRRRDLWHDKAEAVETRRAGEDRRADGEDRLCLRLCQTAPLRGTALPCTRVSGLTTRIATARSLCGETKVPPETEN
jgi:hypothetical protein